MHTLLAIEEEVNRTHAGLGANVCVGILAYYARKTVLTIAPAGTGKSTTGAILRDVLKDVRYLDSVTRNGLQSLASEMNGYTGLIWIDDLGKIDTHYSRVATITTFCELVYSHYVEKHAQGVSLAISDFNGSAIINCQPGVFRKIVQTGEWEATIADKTLRYYHLFRPVFPSRKKTDLSGITIAPRQLLTFGERQGVSWERLTKLGAVQWSKARSLEHLSDYLEAAANIDGRSEINETDYEALSTIFRPMVAERVLMTKSSLEGGRDFDSNLLCLMVEFASYGTFPLSSIVDNYKVSTAVARGLMRSFSPYVTMSEEEPTICTPTKRMLNILDALQVTKAIEGE